MTEIHKKEIENISKEFTKGLAIDIKGSGSLVIDPLSSYLSFLGHKNTISILPEPFVLMLTFKDGTQFIPAGSDIQIEGVTDWFWIDK